MGNIRSILFLCFALVHTLSVRSQITGFSSVSLSPQENRLLFLGKTAQVIDLYTLDLETRQLFNISESKNLKPDLQYLSYPKWGKDGKSIYFISKITGTAKTYRLDLENAKITNVTEGPDTNYYFDISADGKMTYTRSLNLINPTVFLMDTPKEYMVSKKGDNCITPAFSPDGNYIIYKTMPLGQSHLYSVSDKKEIKTSLPKKNCTVIGWLNNNNCVYTATTFKADGSVQKTLAVYHIIEKSNEVITSDAEDIICIFTCSYTNSLLWFRNNNLTSYSIDSKQEHTIPFNGIPLYWSEKGNKLIYTSLTKDKLVLYNLESGDSQELIK